MGVSDNKIFPPSTPAKPCSKLTSSVEAKENRLTSPDLANQKKSSSKNFMSPTISAASKAVVHRKKVLAERNGGEAAEPSCAKLLHRRSTSFDLKQQGSVDMDAAVYNSTDSLSSRVKEMNGARDGEDGDKSKPYDPVFNYCSPRPKFLLYKPDRRSEILRRYEMVESTSSESETGSENEEPLVRLDEEVPENAGEFTDHDDDCKAEETAAQPDKGADAKFEKHVEEIHQTIDEPVHENAGEFADHDDGRKAEETAAQPDEGADATVQKHVEEVQQKIDEPVHESELAKLQTECSQPESGSPKLNYETSETKSEALGNEEDDESQIQSMEIEEEEGEFEEHWSLKKLLKLWFVIVVVGISTLYVSSMNSSLVGVEDEHWMVHSGLHGTPFMHENVSGSVIQGEMAKMGFEEASNTIMDEIIVGDHNDDTADGDHEVKNEESQVESTADQIDATEDGMDSELSEVVHYSDGEIVAEDAGNIVDEELVYLEGTAPEDHDAVSEVVEPKSEASEASMAESAYANDQLEGTVVFEDSTGEELEAGDGEVVDSPEALTESGDDETRSNLEEAEASEVDSAPDLVDELTPIYTRGTDKDMIFSVAFALLLAFLGGLGFQKLKRTTKPPTKESAGVTRPDANIGQHQVKQVDPSEYPSLSQSFKNEAGAPRVELLGEFTIGEDEVSSYSLRTNWIENHEDSTYSFSQRNLKMSAYQTWTTPADSHPAASGFSSTTDFPPHGSYSSQRISNRKEFPTSSIDSPSYESFTTELMLRKKEEARGSDKVVVTPVRRSSRIRGRMTPGASS